MFESIYTMEILIKDAIKYNETLLDLLENDTEFKKHPPVNLIYKASQTALDCLNKYRQINDDMIKNADNQLKR